MQTEQQTEQQEVSLDLEGLPVVSLEGSDERPTGYDNVEPVEHLNDLFKQLETDLSSFHPDQDIRNALYGNCCGAALSGSNLDFYSYASQVLESANLRVNTILEGLQHPDLEVSQTDLMLIQPKCLAFAIGRPNVSDQAIANFAIAQIDDLNYRDEIPTGGMLASVKRWAFGFLNW